MFSKQTTDRALRLAVVAIVASAALLPCAEPTNVPLLHPARPLRLRAPKLTGGGISSYSLGSDHLSLRLPVNCTFAEAGDSPPDVYNLRAPFHILYIQVNFLLVDDSAIDCRISHGDVSLTSRVANFSLGLGPNSLTFLTEPGRQGPPRRIQLHIRRLERPQLKSVKSHSQAAELRVCQLVQDCDFVHSGGESCGLAPVPADAAGANLTWATWLRARRDRLPQCGLGDLAEGARWFIPCGSCGAPELCAWRLARWWHPGCLVEFPATDWMRKRLDGVRVVFLGDSTLRGLMFSLFHIANGSLHRWQKSHDTLTLMDRDGRSRMDFSYYPQFWLPGSRATGFRETLRRILLISQNGTQFEPAAAFNRTVIVIGGAQWLTGAELLQTRELLGSLGLQVPVIVKDLSPGFHIRVPGVTYKPLTVDTARELSNRNSQLHSISASLGFSVLPTFRLSAARYREFHPGKCACHFHTVTPRQRRPGRDRGFEVDGDIHRTCLGLLTALLDSVL